MGIMPAIEVWSVVVFGKPCTQYYALVLQIIINIQITYVPIKIS